MVLTLFAYRGDGGVRPRACVMQPLKTAAARRFALRESGCERFGNQCVC